LERSKSHNWEQPSADAKVERFVLSEKKPAVLYIPAGFANGFMSLTKDAQIMFFSTSTLDDRLGDDFRYDARHWTFGRWKRGAMTKKG